MPRWLTPTTPRDARTEEEETEEGPQEVKEKEQPPAVEAAGPAEVEDAHPLLPPCCDASDRGGVGATRA